MGRQLHVEHTVSSRTVEKVPVGLHPNDQESPILGPLPPRDLALGFVDKRKTAALDFEDRAMLLKPQTPQGFWRSPRKVQGS